MGIWVLLQGTPKALFWEQTEVGGVWSSTLGESLSILVVPQQHLLGVCQSHEGSRGQHPRLARPPAQGFPEAPGSFNEVLGPPNQGSHWCAQALGGRGESPGCLHPQACIPVLSAGGGDEGGQGRADTVAPSGEGLQGPRARSSPQRRSGTQLGLLLWAPP